MKARAFTGALAGAVLTAGLVAGTRVPWLAEPGDEALVRLSWRALGERLDECREPSAEEQAKLPAHMRQPRICERRLLPFHLAVRIDGRPVFDSLLHASGAREDRPTYVFHDFRVTPGPHRVEVRFEVDRPPGSGPAAQPALELDEPVELAPRQILLVARSGPDAGDRLHLVGARP